MDPQVGGSFIPKQPLTSVPTRGGGFGLLFLIALLIFIASLVAGGAVFLYQQYLNKTIANNQQSLALAQGAYDPKTIEDLESLDNRINNAEKLLKSHIAVSGVFSYIGSQTKVNVYFTSFAFSLNPDGSGHITLNGVADSFATVALQSDQFGSAKVLKNVVFSNIVSGTSGGINFTVTADIDASTFNYASVLGSPASVPAQPASGAASSTQASSTVQ